MKKLHKFLNILRTPYYRQALLRYRVAAAVEHDALLSRIGEKLKTVVDIGANRGQFALATRHHAQEAYIIAFEPLQEAAEVFAKVFRADPGVELHRCAISRCPHPTGRNLYPYIRLGPQWRDESSSLATIQIGKRRIR